MTTEALSRVPVGMIRFFVVVSHPRTSPFPPSVPLPFFLSSLPSLLPFGAPREAAVSQCLSLGITSSLGLAPPKMAELGLATWLRGAATVRGFSCNLGLCALSSAKKKLEIETLDVIIQFMQVSKSSFKVNVKWYMHPILLHWELTGSKKINNNKCIYLYQSLTESISYLALNYKMHLINRLFQLHFILKQYTKSHLAWG